MSLLKDYLTALRLIHSTGRATPETSYYGPLETLLNEIGKTLLPKAHAVIQVSKKGAGLPDGGIFESTGDGILRSLIEIKATADDAWRTAAGAQVTKYWNSTPLVLVTNYCDFVVVGRDELTGKSRIEETFRLADSEVQFWNNPIAQIVREKEDSFLKFLTAVMLREASITDPRDLAEILAHYARLARQRILDIPAGDLVTLRAALEGVLGIQFQTEEAERLFFRSSMVQTLFYGLFSAWVLWAETSPPEQKFDWRITSYVLNVPVVDVLFAEFAKPRRLKHLQLVDLLALAGSALNRVDRRLFLKKFQEGHAVTYFYEPFLTAFDPQLRDELGVWYTPSEVVQYQVARIHRLLQEDLGVADGLADDQVIILDPCVGTGSYLLEVARTIHQTFAAKGEGGQAPVLTRRALQQRIYGFEILTAPFVIAHLQLGHFLANLEAPLEPTERLPIYLTNALTGWEIQETELRAALQTIKEQFPDLEMELSESDRVKRRTPIMVILGNPPYNAYAGVGEDEEADLVAPYKFGLNVPVEQGGWGIRKFNLDDLYIRFFRLAERQIAESGHVDKGIVCFISNNSFIEGLSHPVMRQHLLDNFQQIWIDNLHGNRLVSERTPAGNICETIFNTGSSSPGIKLGTSITILARKSIIQETTTEVLYRDIWGRTEQTGRAHDKRQELLASLDAPSFHELYTSVIPERATRYIFSPVRGSDNYLTWPLLTDLAAASPSNGLMEKRNFAMISIDHDPLEQRMRAYFNPEIPDTAITGYHSGLMTPAARFDPVETRRKLLNITRYHDEQLRRYVFKPLDTRWAYVEPNRPLWNEPRPALFEQAWEGNRFLLSRPKGIRTPEGPALYYASVLGDNDLLTGHAYYYPFTIQTMGHQQPNLSSKVIAYLHRLNIEVDATTAPAMLWLHALAIGYAPAYLEEQADGLRGDWPRIPMPEDREVLTSGAALGEFVAQLLDPLQPIKTVTTGDIRPGLVHVGYLAETYISTEERILTVNYRSAGKIIRRDRTPSELTDLEQEASTLNIPLSKIITLLGGPETYDVVWNTELTNQPRWQNIPVAAWEYTIGGYPVLKKWLSYRHNSALGRPLHNDELRLFRDLARRTTTLLLLGPQLDQHYQQSKATTRIWAEL